MELSVKEFVGSKNTTIRPIAHLHNCHLVLFNGNGKCNCGEDERWDAAKKLILQSPSITDYNRDG